MALSRELAAALHLADDAEDEEVSAALVAVTISATRDKHPELSLARIYNIVSTSGLSFLLDPLNTVPVLLPIYDNAARDILGLIGECCPPKEVVMAVQEGMERLEDAEDAEEEDDEGEFSKRRNTTLVSTQFQSLLDLYAGAIPRLKLRRMTASETLRPLLAEIERVSRTVATSTSRDTGRAVISSTIELVKKVFIWVKNTSCTEDDFKISKANLRSVLDSVIVAFAHCIDSYVAQRTFESCFPRLTIRSSIHSGWEDGERIVLDALSVQETFGVSTSIMLSSPNQSSLIYLAHTPMKSFVPDLFLHSMVTILVDSIQENILLDESLAFLIKSLHQRLGSTSSTKISPEIAIPLCTILPTLASTHPNPTTRHQAFRILSLLLSFSPSQLRLQFLTDYTAKSEYPQMRVAAVSLVKEAILEAFGTVSYPENLFSSPLFFRVFGPVLFRPDPPNLFGSGLSRNGFMESTEPQRLTECLSLYYIILQRDSSNLTGVRNKDVMQSVESSLLAPLREVLEKWMDGTESDHHIHSVIPLFSLKIGLERVDAARATFLGSL